MSQAFVVDVPDRKSMSMLDTWRSRTTVNTGAARWHVGIIIGRPNAKPRTYLSR